MGTQRVFTNAQKEMEHVRENMRKYNSKLAKRLRQLEEKAEQERLAAVRAEQAAKEAAEKAAKALQPRLKWRNSAVGGDFCRHNGGVSVVREHTNRPGHRFCALTISMVPGDENAYWSGFHESADKAKSACESQLNMIPLDKLGAENAAGK